MEWEKRRFFVAVSAYRVISKGVENFIFRHNRSFRHTCIYKQPILTKQWNYIFVQVLHSYLRYIDKLWNVFFLLLPVILSELLRNQEEEIELQKKVHRRKTIFPFKCFFLSDLPHFLRPFNYLMAWLHYFLFYHYFCNEICTNSVYSIKIDTEPSGLLFWKISL